MKRFYTEWTAYRRIIIRDNLLRVTEDNLTMVPSWVFFFPFLVRYVLQATKEWRHGSMET